MTTTADSTLIAAIKTFAGSFDERLSQLVTSSGESPEALEEAMRYSLLGPGKRLRPYLITECCTLAGGNPDDAFPAAAAMEMVHAFSLIHDDLPAMDDDDLRRGRATNHKVYGEATAILAGDGLLSLAFETLATGVDDPTKSTALVAELARNAGWRGMIGGQSADLTGEHEPPSIERVRYIHERKTGALFQASCRMGGIAGGADSATLDRLARYGLYLGLAFQIADDLLDVTSSAAQLGKNTCKDHQHGKQTYPASVGIEESRHRASEAADAAVESLNDFVAGADRLRTLAQFAITRQS